MPLVFECSAVIDVSFSRVVANMFEPAHVFVFALDVPVTSSVNGIPRQANSVALDVDCVLHAQQRCSKHV